MESTGSCGGRVGELAALVQVEPVLPVVGEHRVPVAVSVDIDEHDVEREIGLYRQTGRRVGEPPAAVVPVERGAGVTDQERVRCAVAVDVPHRHPPGEAVVGGQRVVVRDVGEGPGPVVLEQQIGLRAEDQVGVQVAVDVDQEGRCDVVDLHRDLTADVDEHEPAVVAVEPIVAAEAAELEADLGGAEVGVEVAVSVDVPERGGRDRAGQGRAYRKGASVVPQRPRRRVGVAHEQVEVEVAVEIADVEVVRAEVVERQRSRGVDELPVHVGVQTVLGVHEDRDPCVADHRVEVAVSVRVEQGDRGRHDRQRRQARRSVGEGARAVVQVEPVRLPVAVTVADERVEVAVPVDVAEREGERHVDELRELEADVDELSAGVSVEPVHADVAEKQVGVAVAVEVAGRGGGGPGVVLGKRRRRVGERSVEITVEEAVLPRLGEVEVDDAVAVIVGGHHRLGHAGRRRQGAMRLDEERRLRGRDGCDAGDDQSEGRDEATHDNHSWISGLPSSPAGLRVVMRETEYQASNRSLQRGAHRSQLQHRPEPSG